jgi:hypothetical protein
MTYYTMMFLKFYEFVKTDLLFAIFVKKACKMSTEREIIFAVVAYY